MAKTTASLLSSTTVTCVTLYVGELAGICVDLLRNRARHGPRAVRATAHEPDALEAHVVQIAHFDDVFVGVHRAGDRGLFDRLELRIAGVLHLGRFHVFLADARRLRDLSKQDRLGRLVGPWDGCEHVRSWMREWNLLEILGEHLRGKRPRTREIGRGEPATRHQEIDRPVFTEPEDIALGVVHPEQRCATHEH